MAQQLKLIINDWEVPYTHFSSSLQKGITKHSKCCINKQPKNVAYVLKVEGNGICL